MRGKPFEKGYTPWNKGKPHMPGVSKPWKKGFVPKSAFKRTLNFGELPKCPDCGKQLATYISKRCKPHAAQVRLDVLRAAGIKGYLKQDRTRKPTSIETAVYNELKKAGIVFETQKVVGGKFIVDAYIPSLNLIIEVDGSYWHSLDRIKKKDKAENAYLAKCGYKVLRIPEKEVSQFSTALLS